MPTFEFDELLLGKETLDFDKILLDEKEDSFDRTLLEEETTPWEKIVRSLKKADEWFRTEYPKYDPLSFENQGRNWTTIARILPGQEDLPSWDEQKPARQLLTYAQNAAVGSVIPLLIKMGITSIAGIRNAIKYNRELKRSLQPLLQQAKKQAEFKALPKFTKPAPFVVSEKLPSGQVRRVAAEKPTGLEKFFPITKKVIATPPSMVMLVKEFEQGGTQAVVNAIKAPYAVVEIAKRDPLRIAIENLAKIHIKAHAPSLVAMAKEKAAKDIALHVMKGLPQTFKPAVADTMIDQAFKLIAAAIPQLEAFGSWTPPRREVEAPVKELIKREFVERPLTAAEIKKPAEVVEKITPPKLEEPITSITEKQLHTIESLKGEKKFSPRIMRKATMAFADKPDVESLNEQEAAALIEGMKAVPLRASGKPYLPPHTGDLLPSHFFTKGRAAGIESMIVPAWRYMERINAKEIYDEVEGVYINYQQEVHDKFRLYDELDRAMKGIKGQRQRVFDYVDGVLPENITLTPQETVAANKLRAVFDDFADRLNIPPEHRKEHYIYHLFNAATRKELTEKHPFVDEAHKDIPLTDAMMSALAMKVPKEIFTPTLLERLGRRQGLVRDWKKAARALTSIDLRRIHLQPAFEKIRPLVSKYPETSRRYINDWLAYAVLKKQPPLDQVINARLRYFTDFIENASKGKVSFGANPMKTLGYVFSKAAYGGAVAFNIAIVGKNLTQQMLIPPLLRNPVHYGQAWGDIFTDKGKYLLGQSKVLIERFPMEAFDPKDIGKWLQKGMTPYKLVDYLNVSIAFLAGHRDALGMKLSPEEAIKYADRIAKISQYSYRPIDMPQFMWEKGGVGRIAGVLQTWPINYFMNYIPELVYPIFTGYDTAGNKVPIQKRAGLLNHLVIASLFIYGMYKFARVDFRKTFGLGVIPAYLMPALNVGLSLGMVVHGLATNDYREIREGKRKLLNMPFMFIPAGVQQKKTYDAYQRLTTGVETDKAGRMRRDVTKEEAIKGIFTYPAERSDFWDTQNKVGELETRMYDIRTQLSRLQSIGASYPRIKRLEDKLKLLGKDYQKFSQKLGDIREGYPTEDDRNWIEKILHTWNLWP